jgi:N12 class adenine-specific DNA methylase/superfamily I DNA/RNA helicase
MPNTSVNGPSAPDFNDPADGLETKAAGHIVKRAARGAGHAVGGAITIDSLGRRWNSSLHPRDANGRFIETGGIASIPALGVRGKVVRAMGNGRVELRLANGDKKVYPGSQIRMVARPDGSKPIDMPDPKDATAFKKAITKINDEDKKRLDDPKRGDGVDTPDEGDWDGDGILNEKDETPLGEKKPAKGRKRKGGEDAGHGYTLHSKPEGGESADVNHTLEDADGNIIGTATSGIPSRAGQTAAWRGQVGGEKIDARNKDGWVLAAKRAHVRQARNGQSRRTDRAAAPAPARKPKQEVTAAHREERDQLGQPGRVAYDLARHDGKNHVQAMNEGQAADRTRRAVKPGPNAPEARDHATRSEDDQIAADRAAAAEQADAQRRTADADRRAADAERRAADAERRAAESERRANEPATLFGDPGNDDENTSPRTGRPETDKAENPSGDRPVGNNGTDTPNEGETSERKPVREGRGELLADVPAVASGDDGEPDRVLPEPRDAGAGRDRLRAGGAPAGGDESPAGGRDLRAEGGGSDRGSEGGRGAGADRAGVPAPGAGDRGEATRGSDPARVGSGAGDSDGVAAPKGRSSAEKNAARATSKFTPDSQADLAPKGEAAKVEANMAALRTLRKVQAEDRPATKSEQAIMARWAGWGALPDVFDERKPRYAAVRDELGGQDKGGLMSKREWDDAKANTLNAHYTDADLVKETWTALEELGFTGGDVLEPGSGIGNFIGLAPKGARITGVEVDPITAAMSQMLYPDADIHHESFGDSPFRSNVFDAVVGNVPFGNFPVTDKVHNPGNRMSIHNHFIVKALDELKPGGVMAVLTSQWTLDGPESAVHKKRIAEKADLIGAVRLPSGTHKDTAGTDVVTDLLLFRKRKDGEVPGDTSWTKVVPAVDRDGQPVMGIARKGEQPKQQTISAYYQSHPDNMLGDLRSGGYNGHDLRPNGDTKQQMHDRLAKIAEDAKASGRGWNPDVDSKIAKRAAGDEAEGRILFSHEEKDAKGNAVPQFTVMEDGKAVPLDVPNNQRDELRRLLELSNLSRQLLDREAHASEDDPVIEDYRKRLNKAYDDYVAKYGPINRYKPTEQLDKDGNPKLDAEGNPLKPRRTTPQQGGFRRDLYTSAEVYGLEKNYDPVTNTAQKSDLFEKRQVNPKRVVAEHADTPEEAVALLNEQGHDLTWANLAKALDVPESKVKGLAGDSVFEAPFAKDKLIPRAEYLSDNVREKLKDARKAAETDPKFERNVAELEAIVPPDADLSEMPLQLGADWIDPAVVTKFAQHLMKQGPNGGVTVEKDYTGNWSVKRPSSGSWARNGALENERWGTDRRNFYDLMTAVLKQQHRGMTVMDKDPSDGSMHLNKEATEAAREKALEIAAEFENWAYSDAGIAEVLSKAYSERFRAIVPRSYDNSPRRAMPGMTAELDLRQHQNDAVTRAVSEPSVLFEHVVGAGKTYTLAGSIMELRRLGLAKKPVLTVPNHMLGQWTSEFKELYPNAKILAADGDVLSGKEGRARFAALARNSDWDVVLMTHTAFESIPVSKEKLTAYLGKELDLLESAMLKAKADFDDKSVKQIQTQIKKKRAKLEKQLEARKDDDGITFENIGFDYIAADEAHVYKNLDFNTRMDGVASPEGSNRARDRHMKIETVRGDDPKQHTVAFATGTPISNTLSEMYTMTRFLRPDLLEDADVADFDSWAATFAKVEAKLETNTAGNGYVERSRMRGFTDALGDGLRIWRTFSDTKTADDLNLPRPKIKGGERQVHVVEQSDGQRAAMAAFKSRVDNLPTGRPEKGDDTHVAIIGDGRRAAIDPRLMSERGLEAAGIDPDDEDYADSPKITAMANNIAKVYAETKDNKYLVRPLKRDETDGDVAVSDRPGALQMVMADSSAPSKKLNAYQMLKDELVARGIPADRIRFIQDYKTADEKARLFEDARQGKVSVLLGSTAALGTGTNVQNRLYALHHMDGSWKPSDIEQREGRILRQGNQHDEVEIHVYATKGTHDIKTWDMTAYKQNVLDAMKAGDYDMRGVEFSDDVDPLTDFDTITGMASENPLVQDRREVEQALKKLTKSAGRHSQAVELANSRAERSRMVSSVNRNAAAQLQQQLGKRVDTKGDLFKMDVRPEFGQPVPLTDRKAAAEALQKRMLEGFDNHLYSDGENFEATIGTLGGFPVRYFRRKGMGGKNIGVLRLGPAESADRPYGRETIPVKPVEFSKADLRDNPTGVLQRLENRVSSMEDQIKEYEAVSERADADARESADNALRGFAGAQDLMDAQRRKALLDKMLSIDEGAGESIDPADMREYEALSHAADERAKLEKADRAAQLAAKKAEKAGAAKVEKVAASNAEKATAQKDLADQIAKARAEKRAAAPKAPEGEQDTLDTAPSARPTGRVTPDDTVTVDPADVRSELDAIGATPPPLPEAPSSRRPGVDGEGAAARITDPSIVQHETTLRSPGVKSDLMTSLDGESDKGFTIEGNKMRVYDVDKALDTVRNWTEPNGIYDGQDPEDHKHRPAMERLERELADAAKAKADAPAADEPNIVEATNEGQLPGQTRLGGDDMQSQITEDFMRTEEAPAPKPAPEPEVPAQDGPDLFAEPDATEAEAPATDTPAEPRVGDATREAIRKARAERANAGEPAAADSGSGDGGDATPPAPAAPEPIEPNAESEAVAAVPDFDSLHGTIREGLHSSRLRQMLEEDTLGEPLTPGDYRDELAKVITETEKRLANTRRVLGDDSRDMPGAARDAWQGEQDGYLHDLPVLRAAHDKAASLADGWVDPTPAETERLRAARANFRNHVKAEDVSWHNDPKGNPVGEYDGYVAEVRTGSVGPNKKVNVRTFDRDGSDASSHGATNIGMIPNGATNKAEAEAMVKDHMAREIDRLATRDRARELDEARAAFEAARGGEDRAPATPNAPEADEPQSPDELPDTAEDLNLVPDPEPIEHPAAAERLPGEKFDPTPQQQEVYDSALDGKDVVIQAKAGAGKTSTLEGLARRIEQENPDDRIAYVAFNKSVQVEAQGRMPKNVEPRTGHSIAFAWASDDLKERFDRRGLRRPDEIARHLGINEDMKVPGEKALSPKEQAMAVVRTLDTFANSADDEISATHLPERMHGLPQAEQDALVAYAKKGWADLLDAKGGQLNLTLDHMRKMWALSKPDFTKAGSGLKRRATVLFLDEAQDTPPVLAKVIADQKMRKVIVGDADQAIYGFTGATDYLSTAQSDVELPLTKSFRFGPQVADYGNRFLQLLGSKGRVEGAGPDSKIVHGMTDADAILVRSNGGMIGELMRELENGRTVGVPKGTKKDLLSLVETARYLKGEGPMPERLHDDLAPFRTWAEVVEEAAKGDDPKLKMLSRIVGEHGIDELDNIVQQVTELGDDGLAGVEFENMPHGLVARGKTFGIKDDLKAAGFRWTTVPGETIDAGPNKGQPLKAWTAGGDEATREARLAKLREAKAGPTPDVVVSTAHKSKGLEWDRVKIGDDFQGPKTDPATGKTIMPNADENRLAYVAVTRAQKELDPGSLSWVEDYTDKNGGTPGKVKVPAAAVRPEDRPAVPEAPEVPNAPEPAAVDAPEAPAAPAPTAKPRKKGALDEITFHESYGDVTKRELRAIKKHNVSPSDHRALSDAYGDDHDAIEAAITDPKNHLGDSNSFSEYQWRKGLAESNGFDAEKSAEKAAEAPEDLSGMSDDAVLDEFRKALVDAPEADRTKRLEREVTSREEARRAAEEAGGTPDYRAMSDGDLMNALADAETRDDMDAFKAILAEQMDRENHAMKWGTPWEPTESEAAPAKPKTKRELEKQWTSELHDANAAILLPFYRKSGHPYAENATDGREMLDGLNDRDKVALLNGNTVSRLRLANMSEESTMALFGMTPAELRKDKGGLGIPGAIKKDDWFEDKRNGGDGFGSSLHDEDQDRLHHGDPVDLRDEELDSEIDRLRKSNDEDRREELLAEKVERERKSDEDRQREDRERDERREKDAADAKDFPEDGVRDLDADELDEKSKDEGEEGDRARGEKHRREQLSDDEREQEEDERRRRRHRRNRRRRRRNRRGGHGGNGLPHLGMPHLGMPHLPHDRDDSGRIPGDKDAVEKALAKRDAKTPNVDDAAADLGMDTSKAGRDMTPEELAKDAEAIDNAYGDPAPDLDALVAAETLPADAVPGSGTVDGMTRDDLNASPANDSLFNTAMKALGEPGDGRKVTDAASLRDELGAKYADQLLDGKGIPARYAGSKLSAPDTKALFGKTPDELKDMGDAKVRWAGVRTPERVMADNLAPLPGDAPEAPSSPGPIGEALPRKEAFAQADGEWATIPTSDLKKGDLLWSNGRAWPVDFITKHDDGAVSVHTMRPESAREAMGGFSTRYDGDKPVQVHVPVGRALDAGKNGIAERKKRRKAEDAVAQHAHEQAMADRLITDGGLMPEPNGDGSIDGGPDMPLSKWASTKATQLYGLADADGAPVVSGVTKDGKPLLGTVRRDADDKLVLEGPDGTMSPLNPEDVQSMRLVSGEAAMPAAEGVPGHRLRPGSSFTSGFEYGPNGEPITPLYTVVSAKPGTPLIARPAVGGAEKVIAPDSSNVTVTPVMRHSLDQPSVADTPAERTDAPAVADVPETAAPEAPAVEEAPEVPEAPEAPNAGEPTVAEPVDADGRGASTLPRKPVEPEAVQAPEPAPAPEADEPAPAVVRTMDAVDELPTALERITGRNPDWVTPDALQIGDFAWVDGMDERGRPLQHSGYLANDPQPAEFQPSDGSAPADVLGVLMSEEMDGIGKQTMVWVPLDRLAALAPRPEADDVVPEGEQMGQNKLDVANGNMPQRIPTDSKGKLGLFPRTLVTDVDGQREGMVIAARGEDVSVRWGDGNVEDVNGGSLTITDSGIQRPDGWSRDGRRMNTRAPRRDLTPGDPSQQEPIRVDDAVQEELLSVVRADTNDLVTKLGQALDGSKPMSKAEFDRTLQGIVRKHMKESEQRRVVAARRMVASRPYRPGLLTQVIAALSLLTLAIAAAIIATLRWGFNEGRRQLTMTDVEAAERRATRKARRLAPFQKIVRLLGLTEEEARELEEATR